MNSTTRSPPHDYNAERRTFLKAGVAGSMLLLAGRWLAPAAAAEAADGPAFANITTADASVLARIIPVMLSGALPQEHGQLNAAIGEIVRGVDTTIGYQPPGVRGEIHGLFGLLTRSITRVLIAGVWSSWEKASDEDVRDFLSSWHDSRIGMLRSAYVGLSNLITGSWYANPKSWGRIGYPGPPKIA